MNYSPSIYTNIFPSFYFVALVAILLFLLLAFPNRLRKLNYLLGRWCIRSKNYTPITYLDQDFLTPVSKRRLSMVRRKTLVLDMDETLIQSHIVYRGRKGRGRQTAPMGYDHSFCIPQSNATVYVYKRPYVDFFLDRVSQWYNVIVYTAASELYASKVLDFLDAGRNILNRRLYRQDCINIWGLRAKFVSMCDEDLTNVLLLDDCHMENSFNAGNTLHIKAYHRGSRDFELLCMLPVLDALRFTKDVRSILGRNTRYECLTTNLLAAYTSGEEAEDLQS